MQLLILILPLFQLLSVTHGVKQFRLGRSKGGNLGLPGHHHDRGDKLPPARWFKQKLDHSSSSDLRTWKQVCALLNNMLEGSQNLE